MANVFYFLLKILGNSINSSQNVSIVPAFSFDRFTMNSPNTTPTYVDYVSILNVAANGAATFNARGSANVGGATNWRFTNRWYGMMGGL